MSEAQVHEMGRQTLKTAQIHTIVGAGQVGTELADQLLSLGHQVRLLRRSAAGRYLKQREGLSWLRGDATDSAFMRSACAGSDVVYNCANPTQYHKWEAFLAPLARAVREGAPRASARLVVLDNLYMYGHTHKGVMHESTPMRPRNYMGELRKRLAEELFEAHERGELRVTSGRASDYFGPRTPNAAVFLPRTLDRLREGKAVEMIGEVDTRHSYSYVPDVARGLAILGTDERSEGRAWHLPTAWKGTTRELLTLFADLHGQELKIRRVPKWLLNGLGAVVPLVRALALMNYQWDEDFILDDSEFCEQFGAGATPIEEAVQATAQWAMSRNESGLERVSA